METSKDSEIEESSDLLFFNIRWIIHLQFVSWKQTVDQAFYLEILELLQQLVCRTYPNVTLWK
jgi:hypothetical protein